MWLPFSSGELSGVKDGTARVKITAGSGLSTSVEVQVEGMDEAKTAEFSK